jgi:flavin-dependent dehydrogenase
MDYLQLYLDKRFSPSYSWIFPKDGVVNVGLEGDFGHLDSFLADRGLDRYQAMAKQAGIIPVSGVKKLVHHSIALIGDAAGMTNPISGSGLTPIAHAAELLARHIHDLHEYETRMARHPIADPVLPEARELLLQLADRHIASILKALTDSVSGRLGPLAKVLMNRSFLALQPRTLIRIGQALRISMRYGW